MANLKTNYMGIELKNPIIMGANALSGDLDFVKEQEKNGIAAVVYKTIFEQDVQLENLEIDVNLEEYEERHAEMTSILPKIDDFGPESRILKLKEFKKNISIPVIASLNAINKSSWIEYAKQIEKTGVDAIEINLFYSPESFEKTSSEIEEEQIDIMRELKKVIEIPVSVKLSPYYTNCLNMIKRFEEVGIDGFLLFNKFIEPEINIEDKSFKNKLNLSGSSENRHSLKFIGTSYKNIKADFCAGTGVITSEDIIKMILVGAPAVQVVSSIYKDNKNAVTKLLKGLSEWMDKNNYESIEDFQGKLAKCNIENPYSYNLAQYLDNSKNSTHILEEHNNI